jgi:hypothetical protein
VAYARVAVVAQRPVRGIRRGVLVVTALVVLAAVKPWGAQAPAELERPQPAQALTSPAAVAARAVESPISSICHESSSWRVATEGSFVGSRIREWGFIDPVAADDPADPSIPFVRFSYTLLRALGYCAPADAHGPINLEVLVYRLDDSGTSTSVAVLRDTRTPAWSVAGLFSIAQPTPPGDRSTPASEAAASWPPGRYVFALRGPQLGDVWFGADVRRTTAGAPF